MKRSAECVVKRVRFSTLLPQDISFTTLETGEKEFLYGLDLVLHCQTSEAIPHFLNSSQLGFLAANAILGSIYKFSAPGVQANETKSKHFFSLISNRLDWFEKRTKTKNSRADMLWIMGQCYKCGAFGKVDLEAAAQYYQLSANQGFVLGEGSLAYSFMHGEGVVKDESLAFHYCKLAADKGNAKGQYNLGGYYFKGKGVEKNESVAVEWYRLAANQGDADAQYDLAVSYEQGEGVEKDELLAIFYYKLSADQGNVEAQCILGWCYKNGVGVEKDESVAVEWYRLAANQGDTIAQCHLGNCYKNGEGVEKDESVAVEWYRLAANQGAADGQCNLGFCYKNGEGVEKDESVAVDWYRLAANQGHSYGMFQLGQLLLDREEIQMNFLLGMKYLQQSADKGFEGAKGLLVEKCPFDYLIGSRTACETKREHCLKILIGINNYWSLPKEVWMIILKEILEQSIQQALLIQ